MFNDYFFTLNTPTNLPIYNLFRLDDGTWIIEIAVTGFEKENLSVKFDPNERKVIVNANRQDITSKYAIKRVHIRQIPRRAWGCSFHIPADHTLSEKIGFENGILTLTVEPNTKLEPIKQLEI